MTKVTHGTFVVVADGKKALIFRNKGDGLYMNLELVEEHSQDNPPTSEQGSDRPGSVHESVGPRRSSMEGTDWHQEAEDRFATTLATALDAMVQRDAFKRLVLVAPPKMLGVLRTALRPDVKALIVAESAKTLTQHPVPEIERHVGLL